MADLFADALIGRGDGVDPSTLEIGVLITDRSPLCSGPCRCRDHRGVRQRALEHIRDAMRHALDADGEDPELALTLRRLFLDPGGRAAGRRRIPFPPLPTRTGTAAPLRAPELPGSVLGCRHPAARPHRALVPGREDLTGQRQRGLCGRQPEGSRRPDRASHHGRAGDPAHRRMDHPVRAEGPTGRHQLRPPRHRRSPAPSPSTRRLTGGDHTSGHLPGRGAAGTDSRDGAEHAARIGVSLQRAVDRIDPALLVRNRHPAGPRSRDRRCRLHPHPRVDYHARRHLIVLDGDPPPTPGVPASPRT